MSEQRTLEELGCQVADTLGDGPDAARRQAQERALLRHLERRTVRRSRVAGLVPALAAAAGILLVVGAAVLLLSRESEVLPFHVGPQQAAGSEGQWLAAPPDQPLPVVFPRGARIALGRGSAGRVVEARARRVRVSLDRGRVEMRIDHAHRGEREWSVEAGPYQVTAVGTEFVVDWDPRRERFAVEVEAGKVRVRGAGLDADGLLLKVGDRLRADHGKPVAEFAAAAAADLAPAPAPATAPPAIPDSATDAGPDPGERVALLERTPRRRPPRSRRAPAARAAPGWQELHARGEYAAALEAARAAGFAELLTRLAPGALWELAETARFAGKGTEAEQALRALRERFPGTRRARLASFLLGRVAMELHGQPGLAVGWFETSLAEDPHGPLAEEALGRLIDAARRSGRAAQAQRAARRYLERYPEGLFAELARSVLP